MKKHLLILSLLCVFPVWALAADTDFGKAITQARLKVPEDAGVRSFLGIRQKSGQMSLADIDAEIIIVEIFSMYCPYCQKHAPMTNALHQAIEAGSDTRGKVKLIGIGVGNSPFEVKFFQKKYGILFPLFDDANSAVLNSLTGIRTPYYFGIRRNGTTLQTFFSRQGAFDDPQAFLKTVLEKSGQP
ncbi:MAG TPA: TlpA disulfide reductase family protein [Deltaproteobacteria bacterium]|jgi:thiol-disulfide isomerase/thioredoxin|nr:TlpA disulfide reductase family protein [Deltaproteobacteria bacterium]HOI07685.1 TlpA disulfide reductase family protein [Deltaproteobacteria bacterium]